MPYVIRYPALRPFEVVDLYLAPDYVASGRTADLQLALLTNNLGVARLLASAAGYAIPPNQYHGMAEVVEVEERKTVVVKGPTADTGREVEDERVETSLPFVCHYAEGDGSGTVPPCVIIWTTDGFENDTLDHVAVVDVREGDRDGERAETIAQFVTDALNAYVATPEGRTAFAVVDPLLRL